MTKTKGAVAAGHPKTAEAAIALLNDGGNAFDAIAGAILAACVVEPTLTSLGGGGFLLAHSPSHQPILFDFFSQTPQQKITQTPLNFYPVMISFGDSEAVQEFHIGLGSMAVPGLLAGVQTMHQELGRLPWAAIAAPAIDYARQGVPLSAFQHYCVTILAPILLATPDSTAIFAPTGRLVQEGELFRQPELAHSLEAIAQEGVALLYQGEWGAQLVADCQAKGGYLTRADVAAYQVIRRQPLTFTYQGHQVLTNPPPCSGGALIAFTLSLLAEQHVGKYTWGSAEHLSGLMTAMRLTNAARQSHLDCSLYDPDCGDRFLSETIRASYFPDLNKWGSTTHISVMDAEGNAASSTTSNGEGSGYVIPGTGIMVNNMLGEADLNPQGFHQWPCNQRLSSMMSPTMVLKNHVPEFVLGSGGSNRIRSAIAQVLSNLLDFQDDLESAIARPRLHWEAGKLNLEPGLQLPPACEHTPDVVAWQRQNMFFGGVHGVCRWVGGSFHGAGDARRSGAFERN